MAYKESWNYIIAVICIVAIVLTTYIVLTNAHNAATSNSDTSGQAFKLREVGATVEIKSIGLERTYPDTKPTAYAYLDNTQ